MGHVLADALTVGVERHLRAVPVEAYLERRRNVGAECGRAGDVTAVEREARDHRAVVARVLRLRH